jgi:hypothetical protein
MQRANANAGMSGTTRLAWSDDLHMSPTLRGDFLLAQHGIYGQALDLSL